MPLEPLPPLEPSEVLARFEGGESPSSSEREERVTVRERAREIIYIFFFIYIYIYIHVFITYYLKPGRPFSRLKVWPSWPHGL